MKREKERMIPSGNGLPKGRRRSGNIVRKSMAYFLCFLMLMGNIQTVSFAEENAKEIAENLGIAAEVKTAERTEETQDLSGNISEKTEEIQKEDGQAKQDGKSSLEEAGITVIEAEKEQLPSEESETEAVEEKAEEEGSEKTTQKGKEEKQKLTEEANEEKPEYMEAGSFSVQADSDLLVSAAYPEGTFLEGSYMKVTLVEVESKLEEAKALLEKEYQKKNPKDESEIEVLEAVEISFYREINGEEKEVQPKNGKKVEIRLQKTDKIKEALTDEEDEELKIVHLSEELPPEILTVKEEGEDLLFSAKHFSTFAVGRRRKRDLSQTGQHEFKAFWKEAPDPNAGTIKAGSGHSYSDGSNGDMRKQTALNIIPPESNSNAVNTTTLGVELTLRGDKNTVYPKGSVNLYIPARIFKGWDDDNDANWDKNKITVSTDRVNGVYKALPGVIHGIAKYPETNNQSSFHYEIVKRTVDGKTEPYFHLMNSDQLSGGVLFKADIGYNLTPSMLKVKDKEVNGVKQGLGEYDYKFPVSMEITEGTNLLEKVEQDMSVHVETKVNPTKVTLKPGTADVNGGVFFNYDPSWGNLSGWNPAWGDKPTNDPKDYFYAVWYVRVDRARGSSQPFDYKIELDPTKADGGELVGAKKLPMDSRKDYFFHNEDDGNNIEVYAQNGYANIAKYRTTDPDPNGPDKYLVNPLGKEQVGISKDPSKEKLPDHEPYLSGHNYATNGKYNSQLYALLFRYPFTKMTAEKDRVGEKLFTDGLKIKNGIKFTEIWADGYEKTISVEPKEAMTVYPRPRGGGKFYFNKYGIDQRQNYLDIFGLQTIYKDGTSAPLRYGNRPKSFTLSADYNAEAENVSFDGTGYKTSKDPADPNGSGVTITDGKYYLLSSKIKYPSTLNGKTVEGNLNKGDLTGLKNNTNTNDDVYRGEAYPLKDDDYHYSSIYLESMKVYDVEQVSGTATQGLVKFNQNSVIRDRGLQYPPVEIWIREKGSNSFVQYGELYYDSSRQIKFRPAAYFAGKAKYSEDDNKPISATNPVSLKKDIVGFDVAGLQLKQASPYYRTAFDVAYTMDVTPTEEMQDRIGETMNRTDDYNTSFIMGAANVEGWQQGSTQKSTGRIGEYWPQVGYALTPLKISSLLYKSNGNFEDHPDKSAQSMTVYMEGVNAGNLPTSLQGPEYTKKYVLKEGAIYDLLPAGTFVDEDSLIVSAWLGGWDLVNSDKLLEKGKGKDYTVEFIEDWQDSGQTMMIIHLTIPKDKQYWHSYHNRSGWKLTYTLWNPYTNIVNRGRSVKNTLGYVNLDKDTIWNGNYISEDPGKYPNLTKIKYYKELKEEAEKKNRHFTTSVVDRVMPFGPVTVLQAAFTNTVSTKIDSSYKTDNVSYMGDSYKHRLLYQAQATTRTTNMVLFDILVGQDGKINGYFDGVDVKSMLDKTSYDKSNPDNKDTLMPVVYYATEVPKKEDLDLSKNIWHVWNYEKESENLVDKKDIKAIAFDLRKTKTGKNFVLDQQGLVLANVKMLATTDKNKVDDVNTNTAYMSSIQFKGADVPESAVTEMQDAASSHRLVRPLVFSLPVKKQLEVQGGAVVPDIREKFSFKLEAMEGAPLLDEDGNSIVTEKRNPDADGGLVNFEKIRILRPGEYKYKIKENIPEGSGFSTEMGEKFITIKVSDPDRKQLVSDLKYTENKPLTFVNIYGVEAIDPVIKVKKLLTAAPGLKKPNIKDSFNFTLKSEGNNPMPQEAGSSASLRKTNPDADGGEVNFGSVHIEKAGEYRYTVSESGDFPGVVNDPSSTKEIVLTVQDFGTGKLIALMTGDDLTFTNTFQPIPNEGQLSLEKKISGEVPETASTFRFALKPEQADLSQPMPGGRMDKEAILEVSGQGLGNFDPIRFTLPGEYHYTLEEINDGITGYTYDTSLYKISYTVTQSEENFYDLIVTRKISKDGVEISNILFENQYSPKKEKGKARPPIPSSPVSPKPTPTGPISPGGPGEPPVEPDKPNMPEEVPIPENPNPENEGNIPPTTTIPRTIEEIQRRIGEILGAGRKRPLTPEEEAELKHLGEVLGALRKEQSRRVNTADASHMAWYAVASVLSLMLLAFYYLFTKLKKRR